MAVATRRSLQIGEGLTLPIEFMSMPTVVYGAPGTGKSTLGRVVAEEVHSHGQRFCVIDIDGSWYGLKSSLDGKSEGIPVVIFGGDHANLPLEPDAGSQIADIVAEIGQSVVLDLSHLSKGKQVKFLMVFFERLYERNREPLLLLLDEAQRYIPQKPISPEAARCLGAAEDIVKLGRKRGLGSMLFTQRGSGLNKEVSELCAVLAAFRSPGVLDQKRVADWLEANTTVEESKAVMPQLAKLPVGTAIIASGNPELGMIGMVRVRAPRTFDSSATPRIGERRREPKLLAQPDIEALRAKMADAIERSRAEDPKELRKTIRDLEGKLARASWDDQKLDGTDGAHPAWWRGSDYGYRKGKAEAERIEVPIDKQLGQLKDIAQHIEISLGEMTKVKDEIRGEWVRVSSLREAVAPPERISPLRPEARRPPPPPPVAQRPPAAPRPPVDREVSGDALGKVELAILSVLGVYQDGLTMSQLAFRAGYSIKSSGFGVALGSLRRKGLINRDALVRITEEGLRFVPEGVELPPAPGPELASFWLARLGKVEQAVLRAMVDAHPETLTSEEIAARAGYSPKSSGFGVALGKLRSVKLIEGFRVSPDVIGG